MEIINEIKNWRSIRRYKEQKVEKDKIEQILEAGRRAPSWQNLQPWHFLVITDDESKKKLSEIAATKKLVEKAPLVIVILGNKDGFSLSRAHKMVKEQVGDKLSDEQLESYLKQKISSPLMCASDVLMARLLEQASYAAAFMILEASYQGLGSCVVGGIDNILTENSQKSQEVKQFFKIPENYEILVLLTLGYASENVEQRSRNALDELISWGQFKFLST